MDLVEACLDVADSYPERVAIVHNGRPTTYSRLAASVRELANEVARRLGSDPGVVGVLATHAPATVVGLLGVWAAGGTYCPIDPAFPTERRRLMLAAAGCRAVLTPALEIEAGLGIAKPGTAKPGTAKPGTAEPGTAAYCVFTSGSTGAPRPVLTSRRAIGTAVGALRELFGIDASDRVLQFASLSWDTCFEEILPTITGGATLVFHDDAHTGSFPRLLRMIRDQRITVLNLPTAFWHELVNHLAQDATALPGHVRLVVIGGEAASPARLAGWCALPTGGIRLLNTYGCTETTLITHAVDLHGPLAAEPAVPWERTARAPIGRPLPHVVERFGEGGELLIGGPSLADGYLGPSATADTRFVTVGGERFFRTGDRVDRLPDGALVHEGRIDHQLKIRGIRVDPAEVEAQLARHPAVSAVAVTGVTVADHTVLAAYVVTRPVAGSHKAPDALVAELRDFLKGQVPAHLVPSRISIVPQLAYTASGKVDRRRTEGAVA
ncbi:MAG TPA: AMP-binding protein [Pseudonocardiaceae bacterium]|nr:AMP-binding protein [Pseudonocardiaceae bacterium]